MSPMPPCYDRGVTDFREPARTSHISKMVLSIVKFGGPIGTLTCERPYRVALAELWPVWKGPDGNRIPSAIITTAADNLLRPVRDRMSVILPKYMEEFWADGSVADPEALGSVLTPLPDDATEPYEVSSLINYAASDDPRVIARLP